MMTEILGLSVEEALDAAFVGESCEAISSDGKAFSLPVASWLSPPSVLDRRLFLDHCDGPTLDVGCGPGRLVAGLRSRGVHAMGIDVSSEAVRIARGRGGNAMKGDVYEAVPGEGSWQHVLLADGNVGIGGDPARLLGRMRELIAPNGVIHAEVDPAMSGVARELIRLRIEGRMSAPFMWARVGADAIQDEARSVGLLVIAVRRLGHRQVAVMARVPE